MARKPTWALLTTLALGGLAIHTYWIGWRPEWTQADVVRHLWPAYLAFLALGAGIWLLERR